MDIRVYLDGRRRIIDGARQKHVLPTPHPGCIVMALDGALQRVFAGSVAPFGLGICGFVGDFDRGVLEHLAHGGQFDARLDDVVC